MRIRMDRVAPPKFKQNLAGLAERTEKAMRTAANMAASMIQEKARANIASAGFTGTWVQGLTVTVEPTGGNNKVIRMAHADDRAKIFENGGVIKGKPLLWIPLSGTDAKGVKASDYGDLFSVNNPGQKHPLLFSVKDHEPKYFGIESVTIPKKFRLNDIQKSVMANFRQIFDQAWKEAQ